jgi:hypothetical protein
VIKRPHHRTDREILVDWALRDRLRERYARLTELGDDELESAKRLVAYGHARYIEYGRSTLLVATRTC